MKLTTVRHLFPRRNMTQSSKSNKGPKPRRVTQSSTSRFLAELNTQANGSGLDLLARSATSRLQSTK